MIMEDWSRISTDTNLVVDVDHLGPLVFRGRIYGQNGVPDGSIAIISSQGYSFQDEAFIDLQGEPLFLRTPNAMYEQIFKKVQKRLSSLINACRFLLPSLMRRAA